VAAERQLTEQGRERKQQILDAAAALFAERGYATTRIADICTAAGVAKGLFYWYFETKEALFIELVRSMRNRLRRAQGAAIDPAADALTRMRQGAVASVRFMAEHMAFFSLLEMEAREHDLAEVLREGSRIHVGDVLVMVVEAQRDGLVPEHLDPNLLALGIHGAVGQFCHFHRTGRLTCTVDELAEFVADWVVRAVAGEVPALEGR
jgi:AcrR family transcriptional regulator